LGQHSGLIIGRPGLFLMRGGLFRGGTKWLVFNSCYFNFFTRDKNTVIHTKQNNLLLHYRIVLQMHHH
jgi:hypothetical protein